MPAATTSTSTNNNHHHNHLPSPHDVAAAVSSATVVPRTTNSKTIPLSLCTNAGERLYVLENDAYHTGAMQAAAAGGRGGTKQQQLRRSQLPELSPSLADFSVVGRSEGDAVKVKVRIDESEWVVVDAEGTPTR